MYVVCSCVEFDCKNILYKSNSYVSVTVIFTNKSTTAILEVCRGVNMCISYDHISRGELSLWNLIMPDTVQHLNFIRPGSAGSDLSFTS